MSILILSLLVIMAAGAFPSCFRIKADDSKLFLNLYTYFIFPIVLFRCLLCGFFMCLPTTEFLESVLLLFVSLRGVRFITALPYKSLLTITYYQW